MRIHDLVKVAAILIVATACTDISDPVAGTGGAGGMSGTGGVGGADEGMLLPQPVLAVEPASFAAEPPTDSVDTGLGVATGQVVGACDQSTCSGVDPADQWRILPTLTGEHVIQLSWASAAGDLDLFLANTDGAELANSTNPGTDAETIIADLVAGELYVIQVQAFDTEDATLAYTLRITSPL
ncbi:MAG: hypothetical protein AAF500_04485 [Myxococcota bacterium]